MTINLSIPMTHELKPRITVVGVGGAGGNALNNMITSHLEGVEFMACNTDAQALANCLPERKVQLGVTLTHGLGAGARPEVGRAAAEEALDEILEQLQGSHMVFITAGMGGGTGTGAAPVIARAVREQGILTVAVVTKPFQFEGSHRMRLAESGLSELQKYVDTLIVIPNQNLFRMANERTTFAEAFKMADQVLHMGVRGVTDLMIMPGLINLDFADIRTVMSEMGKAMMGTGEADGDRRAIDAAEAAISNPLLDEVSMQGARGVLINITGGSDMTLYEVDAAANRIREEVDQDANIIFGSTFDSSLEGSMRVSVVATGIDAHVPEAVELAYPQAAQTPNMPEAAPMPTFRFNARAVSPQPAPVSAQRPAAANPGLASTLRQQAPAELPAEPSSSGLPSFVPQPVGGDNRRHESSERAPNLFDRMKGLAFSRGAAAAAQSAEEPSEATVKSSVLNPASERDEDDMPAFLKRERMSV
ncbi:cell division protein FtsZ [Arboricoccus pini]|uniref:Cell division protein FtsZ n=1 Tax=Arboricoccus pini TaxID=1963835 RepID=A0A212QAL0_9PROT|nr:cell division protein FtsZ [Arboricoccus pini]SNB56406.1 cell division protein FtsZ [Arboricoccus pini]